MKTILVVLVLCCFQFIAEAQKTIDPNVQYYSWIYLNSSQKPVKGVILETNDSTIQFIQKSELVKNKAVAPYNAQSIPVTAIEKIKIRKKNGVSNGLLLGAIGGAAAGAIIGFADGDDVCDGYWCIMLFSAEEKAALGAFTGIFPGGLIGALVGSRRKTIFINADQNLYTNSRWELDNYSLTKL